MERTEEVQGWQRAMGKADTLHPTSSPKKSGNMPASCCEDWRGQLLEIMLLLLHLPESYWDKMGQPSKKIRVCIIVTVDSSLVANHR